MAVYIQGIGLISRCAFSASELARAVSGQDTEIRPLPLDFPVDVPPAALRRNSRYNKLACAAADQALKNAGIPKKLQSGMLDAHRAGTVFSSGYGAAEYFSSFADSVVRGDPGLCSPARFSGSVPNACLGQVCIINGLKGFSTMLSGGDPLEYAALLLETGRADVLLAGSVEEYFPPLYSAFGTLDAAAGCCLSEGAAMAVLSPRPSENTWCRLGTFASVRLDTSPLLRCPDDSAETEERIAAVLRRFPVPDAFLSAANGSRFDQAESNAFQTVFPGVRRLTPKDRFGETLGCGYMLNVLWGAAAVRAGMFSRALVAGFDMIGNYTCVMLEKE